MNFNSEKKPDSQETSGFELDELKRAQLKTFLAEVANTPLKVKILFFYLSQPCTCMSSCYLGENLGESEYLTQLAAKELAGHGVFNYCPYFAYTDLCHLAFATYPKEIQENLTLLFNTLRFEPEMVWSHFASA